jgi:predicted MPP superfamily phosphohydrolase
MRRGARSTLAAAGVGAGLGAAALAWGAGVERTWYVLRHTTVPVLAPAARGPLRVLHVSDLHLLPGQRRVEAFLGECRLAGSDLVVATGDLIGSEDTVDDAVDLLAGVRDGRPGLAVLGSNDLYGPRPKNPLTYFMAPVRRPNSRLLDTARLVAGLQDTGWQVLDNRRTQVATPVGLLDVAGLADPHIGRDRPEYLDWSPPERDGTALRLGIVHAPYRRSLDVFDRQGYGLVLAGHTHGGQVRLPGWGSLVANCDLPPSQTRGLSRYGDLWLHVSAGLGHARYAPYRFACRPEATVLDLVPR